MTRPALAPRSWLAARLLGVLVLLATFLGAERVGGAVPALTGRLFQPRGAGQVLVQSGPSASSASRESADSPRRDVTVRLFSGGTDEKADLSSRSSTPNQAVRSRAHERWDGKLPDPGRASLLPAFTLAPASAARLLGEVEAYRIAALLERARASQAVWSLPPARGPPSGHAAAA